MPLVLSVIIDDGSHLPLGKRQKLIRIDVKDVNTKEIVATRELSYVDTDKDEDYILIIEKSNDSDLKRHTLERHNDVNQCYINNISICDNIIKVDITSLRCKLCDSNIKSLEDLMEHLQNTHEVKIFTDIKNQMIPLKFDTKILTCAICDNGAMYNKFKSLLEHMKVHYRNYVCQECDAGFINPAQLRVHMNFHDIGNYACEICRKVFTNGRTLKAHVRAVHIVKSQPAYKCGYCNESFQFFHSKERHLQKVHGVVMAPINCQACDKSFTTRSTYLAHMKLNHLMIRPHACTQCNKSFTYSAALKEHERRVHMGLKLYECDLCNKHFSTKNALRQHIRIHTNDRRYKCQICGQAFVAKSSWRGHMRSKHDEMV
ncbi:zinc finger protein 431-like [Galleria mellonella]|uniref:Zinc finger protein 431-like n=1 Tax=Galleria mellonella TaxID=7137 RepID=A0ABM3N0T6_GALME|nr:zinc finger protein 431-like [Galleria mellonella]